MNRSMRAGCLALLLASAPLAQNEQVRQAVVPGQDSVIRVWNETDPSGQEKSLYQLSLDGKPFTGPTEAKHELELLYQRFDPAVQDADVAPAFLAPPANRLFIVQYHTQFIEDYQRALEARGVELHRYLANQSNIVEMDPDRVEEIRALNFVRAVRPFHPAFKLEAELMQGLEAGAEGEITLNVLTMRRGGQEPVVSWVEANGGTVEDVSRETYLMTVTIQYQQIPELASLNAVQWIDRWGGIEEPDMNIAREMHGANFVETIAGYDGTGVRAEVRDVGCETTHPDLQNFILHGTNTAASHGTSTSGIVFGTGLGQPNARGAIPEGFLVINDSGTAAPGGSRYAATGQIADPNGIYRCVFQTNSVGSNRTTQYTSISQNLDLILFDFDHVAITQSQSNANNQMSRPEAWAKNMISCGGINHRNTLTKSDDFWGGASIGPAADGRIKPDLASYYDSVWTTTTGGGYTTGFNGTSAATPIVAGHMGLFYEMWSDGIFGNATPGTTVFDNAPNNTTAKAMMINTASQWDFSGTTHNLTRVHQGWGHPDLQYMYQNRNNMLIVDETDVLAPLETANYYVNVGAGTPQLRVTMVYRDPPGTTSSTLHRINNLDLCVIAPDGTLYKGNFGLKANMTSPPNGGWSNVDTVENVYVANPQAGEWRVTIWAKDVNQDSHVETGALDVDFALVVSGIQSVIPSVGAARVINRNPDGNPQVYTATPAVPGQPVNFTIDTQGFGFATIIGVTVPNRFRLEATTAGFVMVHPPSPRLFVIGPLPGPIATTSQVVTNDPNDVGLTIYTQVRLHNGPSTSGQVTNGQDLVVGN